MDNNTSTIQRKNSLLAPKAGAPQFIMKKVDQEESRHFSYESGYRPLKIECIEVIPSEESLSQ
jgi:hypothetical protein